MKVLALLLTLFCFFPHNLLARPMSTEPITVEMVIRPDSSSLVETGFPSDSLLKDGTIQWQKGLLDFQHWPLNEMETRYYEAANELGSGFSPMVNLYLELSNTELTDNNLQQSGSQSFARIIDITPKSSSYGRAFPVSYTVAPFDTNHDGANKWLQLRSIGPLLKENHTYALLVSKALLITPFQLQASQTLTALLSESEPDQSLSTLHKSFEPLRAYLKRVPEDKDDIAAALVWTTGKPADLLQQRVEQVIRNSASYLSEVKIDGVVTEQPLADKNYCVIKGNWKAPVFVHDPGPSYFTQSDIPLGPVLASQYRDVEFFIALPRAEMPDNGFPLLIYNHGTGGAASQFLVRGQVSHYNVKDYLTKKRPHTIAEEATAKGYAVASMAGFMGQEYCSEHAPWDVPDKICALLAYNIYTPLSFVANLHQMVLERTLFRRLLNQLRLSAAQHCGDQSAPEVMFSQSTQVIMGQSLGSMVAMATAATDQTPYQGVILSGAGNYGAGLPLEYAKYHGGDILSRFLFWEDPKELPDNRFHPFFAVAEEGLATASVALQAHQWIQSDRFKTHVLVVEGTYDDEVAVPMQIELLRGLSSISFGGSEPDVPEAYRILPAVLQAGGKHVGCISRNLANNNTGEKYTVAVRQYPRDKYMSGHHVLFQVPEAREQYTDFLGRIREGLSPVIGYPECFAPDMRFDGRGLL